MAKILLIVAIVVSVATAFLGYLNRQRLLDAKEEASSMQSAYTKANADMKKAGDEVAAARKDLEAAASEKEQAVAAAAAARQEAEQAKSDLAAVQTEVTAKDQQIASLRTELDSRGSTPNAGPTTPVTPEDAVRLQELEAMNATLQAKVEETNAQLETTRQRLKDISDKRMREGLEGRILAVNPAWNFVVLSVGDRNGVVNNAEMLVKRGGQFLGKVRITSVEPSTSIADIVANSVPSGYTIQPGDSVIFTSSAD